MFRIVRKIIKYTAIAVVALVILAAMGLFLLASWKPSGYEPIRLSDSQKHKTATDFAMLVIDRFREAARAAARNERPFSFSFTQDQINEYLASIDHIAALRPPVKHGEIYKVMDQVGLAEPVVHLQQGILTVMVRTRDYEKVLSAGLAFTFTKDAGLKIDLASAHIGRAPIPKALIRNRLQPVKAILRKQMEKMQSAGTRPTKPRGVVLVGFSTRDIARVIRGVITAIDEEPIPTEELVSKVGAKVRVTGIDVEDGKITLHFAPVGRKEKGES